MRHQERRVPPSGYPHPPPQPQFTPQDGANGPHHQVSSVYGSCDGNFDKEKYDCTTVFRGGRYEADSSVIGCEPTAYNRGQPMLGNQNHHVSTVRYDDFNSSRMQHPPTSVSNQQMNPSVGNNFSHTGGYYGVGSSGIGTGTMQRPRFQSGYESDILQQQQTHGHQMQQTMPNYYAANQHPPNTIQYQQPANGHIVFNGQPLQQEPQQQPQLVSQTPQAVMTVQQRNGGQFIVPVPHPQMVTPQYIGQQVMPPAHYQPSGVYMHSAVRPTVFVPRAEVGYAPVENSQPLMVQMPFVVHHASPNQPSDQPQPPYQQGVIEQSHVAVEQFGESEFISSLPSAQPVRPMSMPPGVPNSMPPFMSIMQQGAQQSLSDSRSGTASIPPLVAPSSSYGPPPYPRVYGFHPSAIAPPFVVASHFGMPHIIHSSPGRGRNSRTNSSFRCHSSFHNKSKHNNSPQSSSRQSSVADAPKDDTNAADVIVTAAAEVKNLSLDPGGENNSCEREAEQGPKEKPVLEEQKEQVEKETSKKSKSPPQSRSEVKPEVTKELLPLVASKTESEKRTTVPIVAVAPVMSVKAEVVQTEEKPLVEDDMPTKENVELRIRDSEQTVHMQGLATTHSTSASVKLDCTFCRSLGKSEEVATSHVIRGSDGKVTCPELRKRKCNLCGATGDNSHSAVFCPLKSQQQISESVADEPKISHTEPQRSPNNYNKPIVFERRGGGGYRGNYGGNGHRGGYNQGRGGGGGRYQPRNRHHN